MKTWWAGLAERERQILIWGGLVVLASLLYGAVWVPLGEALTSQSARRAAQEDNLRWMYQATAEVKVLTASGVKPRARTDRRGLLAQVDAATRAAKIADQVKEIQPDGDDQVRVQFNTVDFNKLITWLGQLERSGIRLASLSLRHERQTPEVDARVTLSKGQG